MRNDHVRSLRLNELRRLAFALNAQGKSPDDIVLALKSRITGMGVTKSTAKDYFDTIVDQVGKKS